MCYVRCRYVPSLLHQLVGAVEELEAAIDSEDAMCAVSIIRGRGTGCVKIQAVVKTGPKEAE